jgi:gamma-glutamylcyclotransferase (GGCT)/AIG2-like uncharacterized protein YtfP
MRILDIIVEAGGEPIYYFAYGMLTDPQIMQGAKFVGAAKLQNHRFTFRKYANVEQSGGDSVDGVLWELPSDMIRELDTIESYPEMYGRKTVPVFVNGKRYIAWVYYMTPATIEWTNHNRLPVLSYIKTILNGYKHANLSTEQVNDAYNEIIDLEPRFKK